MSKFAPDKDGDIELLDLFTDVIENSISNYALDRVEDLYDEDDDMILRALYWSRGDKNYIIVINPMGQIKTLDAKVPRDLMLQIHNEVTTLIIEVSDMLPCVRDDSDDAPVYKNP